MRELTLTQTESVIQKLGVETSPLEAFTVGGVHAPISYAWHEHSRHQLVYAFEETIAIDADQRGPSINSTKKTLEVIDLRYTFRYWE